MIVLSKLIRSIPFEVGVSTKWVVGRVKVNKVGFIYIMESQFEIG